MGSDVRGSLDRAPGSSTSATLRIVGAAVVGFVCRAGLAAPPVLVGTYEANVEAYAVRPLDAARVVVACGRAGGSFRVLDVTNRAAPVLASSLALSFAGNRIQVGGVPAMALMTGFLGGLQTVSLADVEMPLFLGRYDNGISRVRDLAVVGDGSLAFIADAVAGLEVVSLANPALPQRLGLVRSIFSNQYNIAGVALSPGEEWLYVAAERGGLLIYSVTNPVLPALSSRLYPPSGSGSFRQVVASAGGGRVYVTGGDSSGDYAFHMISVTNPLSPVLLSRYADGLTGQAFRDVAIASDERTAFLVGDNVGLQVVDISRTGSVHLLASFVEIINEQTPQLSGVALSPDDRTVYLAAGGRGVRLVDVSGVFDIDDDGLPNFWEIQHFGTPRAAVPSVDSDSDGLSNRDEYIADTLPQDSNSVFAAVSVSRAAEVRVGFLSSADRTYRLFGEASPGSSNQQAVTGWLPGEGGFMEIADTNRLPCQFYRIGVALPD